MFVDDCQHPERLTVVRPVDEEVVASDIVLDLFPLDAGPEGEVELAVRLNRRQAWKSAWRL